MVFTNVDVAVIFNDLFSWDVYSGPLRTNGVIDFSRVAVHEIGHVIGLDHENVAPSNMTPVIGNVEVPQADDLYGVSAIYDAPLPPPPAGTCPINASIPLDASFNATLRGQDCNVATMFNLTDPWFAHLYAISVTAPGHLVIRMTSGGFDTVLILLDGQTMKMIDFDDDGGEAWNSMMTRDLAKGDYVVLATSFWSGDTGTYSLASSFYPYSVKQLGKPDDPPNAAGALPAIIQLLLE